MTHRDPTTNEVDAESRAALALSLLDKVASVNQHNIPISTLDAFLSAPEETSADFVRSFLALSPVDRMRLLAEEEEQGDEAATTTHAHGESNGIASTGQSTDRVPALSAVSEVWLNERSTAMDIANALAEQPDARACVADEAALADMDDLEEIDLAVVEDVHTGRMVAFFDHGVTADTTTFDNYVGDDEDDCGGGGGATYRASQTADPTARGTPSTYAVDHVELDTDEMAALLSNATALDDFLRLDSDHDESAPPEATTARVLNVAEETRTDAQATRDYDGTLTSSSHPSSTDAEDEDEDEEALSLPGLDETPDGEAADTSAPTLAARRRASVTADASVMQSLRAIADESDDVVYNFSLDPLYDYDADLVGESFRHGDDRKRP